MVYRHLDPIHDAEAYYNDLERQAEKLPRCSECDKKIYDEYAYYINDEWICEDCMMQYRKEVTAI